MYKLSLETPNEILFDYDIDDLSKQATIACFKLNEVAHTDLLTKEQLLKWINKRGGKMW